MEYTIYYIFDKSNQNDYDYILTKNHLTKALYAIKNSKTETILKRILLNNNYETRVIKKYTDTSKDLLLNELKDLKSHPLGKGDPKKGGFTGTLIEKHNITKQASLTNGKAREHFIYDFLTENKLFNKDLHRAKYIYSEFDFYDNNGYLYEIKSLTYSVNKYRSAVMNSNKIIYDNYIFIFEYTEANNVKELYYHLYDVNKKYNERYITPYNRLNVCSVIDIPICDLVRFYDGNQIIDFVNPCKTITDLNQLEIFKEIIRLDEVKSSRN